MEGIDSRFMDAFFLFFVFPMFPMFQTVFLWSTSTYMPKNKILLILGDKIFTNQNYMQKVKLKRSTKLIFLNLFSKKWNIFCNFDNQIS